MLAKVIEGYLAGLKDLTFSRAAQGNHLCKQKPWAVTVRLLISVRKQVISHENRSDGAFGDFSGNIERTGRFTDT